jgi:hypothetical protein
MKKLDMKSSRIQRIWNLILDDKPTEQQQKNRESCEQGLISLLTLLENVRNEIVRFLNREYLIIPFILGFMILSMVILLAIKLG